MGLRDLTSREAILAAIAECDSKGRASFLATYGFKPARSYVLQHDGKSYDSKAIAGVGHGYQYPGHGPLKANEFSGGEATVRRVLERLGFRVKRVADNPTDAEAIAGERERRERLWEALASLGSTGNVTPAQIDEAGIRPAQTGQGIFRDHSNTAGLAPPQGITLSLLDIGETYQDEFDEDGGIYHYPSTSRGGIRDEAEIEATKSALDLEMLVFVVLRGCDSVRRCVKRGWVVDFDDEARQFLVSFAESATPNHSASQHGQANAFDDDAALEATVNRPAKPLVARACTGQRSFRFAAIKRYGARCALCRISEKALLEVVHIVPFARGGVEDSRNALVFCCNHRRAFDAGLIAFDPETFALVPTRGVDMDALVIERDGLTHLPSMPARAALKWHLERRGRW